jgi:hypothetical protein
MHQRRATGLLDGDGEKTIGGLVFEVIAVLLEVVIGSAALTGPTGLL